MLEVTVSASRAVLAFAPLMEQTGLPTELRVTERAGIVALTEAEFMGALGTRRRMRHFGLGSLLKLLLCAAGIEG